MNKRLVIFGAGSFARYAYTVFQQDSTYEPIAFCVDPEYRSEEHISGLPVIDTPTLLSDYPPTAVDLFVAAGVGDLNRQRAKKCAYFQDAGYTLASHVSSRAIVAPDFVARPNTMIMDSTVIQPFCSIGANCIIWSLSAIAMKSRIEDDCWIVKATLGEEVHLGRGSFAGLNATVLPGVTVGRHCILGAGSIVQTDLRDFGVYRNGALKPSGASSLRVAGRLT